MNLQVLDACRLGHTAQAGLPLVAGITSQGVRWTGLRIFHLGHLAAMNISRQQRKVQTDWTSQAMSYEKQKEGVSAYQARPSCPAAASSRALPPWHCWTLLVQIAAASCSPCVAPEAGPPAARTAEAPYQMLLGISRPCSGLGHLDSSHLCFLRLLYLLAALNDF